MVFTASTVVAIVQPGDLGDDEVASGGQVTSTTTSTTEAPTTTVGGTVTTATTVGGTATTATTVDTTATTVGTTATTATTVGSTATTATTTGGTTSTTVGSGLGAGGNGTTNPDGTISDTGGESWIGLGLALFGLGLVLRRTSRRTA